MTAPGSKNNCAMGYPRDAEVSRNKPPLEVKVVQLRCLCIFWRKHWSWLFQWVLLSLFGTVVCSPWDVQLSTAVDRKVGMMVGGPSP